RADEHRFPPCALSAGRITIRPVATGLHLAPVCPPVHPDRRRAATARPASTRHTRPRRPFRVAPNGRGTTRAASRNGHHEAVVPIMASGDHKRLETLP